MNKFGTIALRFGDTLTADTIRLHNDVIETYNFVYYGKLGSRISSKAIDLVMGNKTPKILLIHSGKQDRYWAYIEEITYDIPDAKYIPSYYGDKKEKFSTWFKVVKIVDAPRDIIKHCTIKSSNRPLSEISKASMSPYFMIEVDDND